MAIAALVIIYMSHEGTLDSHHYDENCLKIGYQIAEKFQNRGRHIEHVELSIAAHHMRF